MNTKRAFFMAALVIALAALAAPLVGLRAKAAGSAGAVTPKVAKSAPTSTAAQQVEQQRESSGDTQGTPAGKVTAETMRALGLTRVANPAEASAQMGQRLLGKKKGSGEVSVQSGQPSVLNAQSALSAALMTESVAPLKFATHTRPFEAPMPYGISPTGMLPAELPFAVLSTATRLSSRRSLACASRIASR